MILTARAPVIMGDELYFYYYGCDNIHDVKDIHCDIGLATLRLDGFCSMSAGDEEGWLISRREVFKTPRIVINAKTEPDGYVVAELLDRNNNVIEGFTRTDCVPFCGDSVRHELSWKTTAFTRDPIEPDKKIRFYLRRADLYSYLPEDVTLSGTRETGARSEHS